MRAYHRADGSLGPPNVTAYVKDIDGNPPAILDDGTQSSSLSGAAYSQHILSPRRSLRGRAIPRRL